VPELSRADELLTQSLKQALALVDIRTLDHFVVAGSQLVSFAERGLSDRCSYGSGAQMCAVPARCATSPRQILTAPATSLRRSQRAW